MPRKGQHHTEEAKRKISEANKRAWTRKKGSLQSVLHINWGHAARSSNPEDDCMYCSKHFAIMAYTYFGAPVCGYCWDRRWRKTEDGECDPPFSRIKHQASGQWV